MQKTTRYRVLFVTAPNARVGKRIAKLALESRRAACVNLIPGLESLYWWKGQIETGREVLLILKTSVSRVASLERLILENHPYDTPEIVALPITEGTHSYLKWLGANL